MFPAATLGGALSETASDPDELRQQADVALYHAKERNRGQFIQYSPDMGTAQTRRFRAIRDVRLALVEDRLDAYYQPIVRLDTGEIVGFEALCRMMMPSGEIIAAANFHEATKDAQIAAELTQRMLLRVAHDVRAWLNKGLPIQHVGVNLSAVDFQSGDIRGRLHDVLEGAGVPLKHIIIEVTESVYLGQREHRIAQEIAALRNSGLRVALDDFGTGYASLTHLLTVPVDIIKIDKSFTDRLVPGDAGIFIVEGLMSIASNLGIKVVAEGIETQLQADQLLKLGCKLGQGYLYSKAVDRIAATALLEERGQRIENDVAILS
jgi:EAL domain-containing protein (putative c-di-GMP-specific phosphodiesterase class I)